MLLLIIICAYFLNDAGIFNLRIFSCIPYLSTAFTYFPYFSLGYAIEVFRKKYSCKRIVVIPVTIVLLILSWLEFRKGIIPNGIIAILLGSATIYIISYWVSQVKWFMNLKIYKIFLTNSMYIYLFHEPVNFLVLRWASSTNAISSVHGTVLYFAGRTVLPIIISIFLGIMILKVKEKEYKIKLRFFASLYGFFLPSGKDRCNIGARQHNH